MDLHKVNVTCADPLVAKQTNKRYRYGDIPKDFQKKKYSPLRVPPPPKLNEKKIFSGI